MTKIIHCDTLILFVYLNVSLEFTSKYHTALICQNISIQLQFSMQVCGQTKIMYALVDNM